MQWFEISSLRVPPQVKAKMQELLKVQHYHKVGQAIRVYHDIHPF